MGGEKDEVLLSSGATRTAVMLVQQGGSSLDVMKPFSYIPLAFWDMNLPHLCPPATFLLTLIYLAASLVTQKTQMAKAEFHRDF